MLIEGMLLGGFLMLLGILTGASIVSYRRTEEPESSKSKRIGFER